MGGLVTGHPGRGGGRGQPGRRPGDWPAWSSPNTIESSRAAQDASMTFSDTPMVVHVRSPSVVSISTRVTAAVP